MLTKRFKGIIKNGFLGAIYILGALKDSKHIPILIYHSVDDSGSCISVSPSDFEKEMIYIKENGYKTLNLNEAIGVWKGEVKKPHKAIVITFDDGFQNNYDIVFPILKRLDLTATIFLTTGYLGKRCAWDKKGDIPQLPLLSWEMIKEMHEYGIDFQPHSVTHPHLPLLSEKEIRYELNTSRATIEEKLGKKANIFCYPYTEFNEIVVQILMEEGFVAAVTGHPEKEDLYAIRRVGRSHLTTPLAFKTALKGRFSLFYSFKRIVKRII